MEKVPSCEGKSAAGYCARYEEKAEVTAGGKLSTVDGTNRIANVPRPKGCARRRTRPEARKYESPVFLRDMRITVFLTAFPIEQANQAQRMRPLSDSRTASLGR